MGEIGALQVRDALQGCRKILGKHPTASLDCEVLLGRVLGCSREKLISHPEKVVPVDSYERFTQLLARRRKGEPTAYLINEKEFFGLKFYVDERVMIPRPETELLVERVVELARDFGEGVRILDVGTGSGCIAVVLGKNIENAEIVAVDVSEEALNVARKNVERYGLEDRIVLKRSDLLNSVKGEAFDIIVANLPYIGKEKYRFVAKEVEEYEPHVALFGGEDGLELYKKLFQQMVDFGMKPRYVLGEFGFLQGEELGEVLSKFFDQRWTIIKDYASIDRLFIVNNKC